MAKKRRTPAVLIVEAKCSQIVSYTHYPERGRKSHRHGPCSRWTCRTCGLCRRHCEARSVHGCGVAWAAEYKSTGRTIKRKVAR